MKFSSINRKKVEGNFTGGSITSDGGLLLLGVDECSGLSKRMSQAIQDERHSSYVDHSIIDLLKTASRHSISYQSLAIFWWGAIFISLCLAFNAVEKD